MQFLPILQGISDCYLLQILLLISMLLSVCLETNVLSLHIALIAHYHETHLRVSVNFGFLEPSRDIIEGFAIGDVVDEDGSCG